jgi:hypothetical protein
MKGRGFSSKRTLIIIGSIILVIFCVFPIFYFTGYRWIDSYVCPRVIAHRVGIEPSYLSIIEYIKTILTPGIDRTEVTARLSRIGQVKVWQNNVVFDNRTTDEIHVILCGNPMSRIIIFAHYSLDGKLIDIEFEGS